MTFPMRRVVRAMVMSLMAAGLIALVHVINGQPPSPFWSQIAGFVVGALLFDLLRLVFRRRGKLAAR